MNISPLADVRKASAFMILLYSTGEIVRATEQNETLRPAIRAR